MVVFTDFLIISAPLKHPIYIYLSSVFKFPNYAFYSSCILGVCIIPVSLRSATAILCTITRVSSCAHSAAAARGFQITLVDRASVILGLLLFLVILDLFTVFPCGRFEINETLCLLSKKVCQGSVIPNLLSRAKST